MQVDRCTLEAWYALAHRSEDFGPAIEHLGVRLRLVARLDVLDDAAMSATGFAISGEKDRHRSSQKRRYPDGRIVEDKGLCHYQGQASFRLYGLTPGRDALLLSRVLRLELAGPHELWVNGVMVHRQEEHLPRDSPAPWYNLPYILPGAILPAGIAQIEVRALGHDLGHFCYWLFQPEEDTVLGPVPQAVLRAEPAPHEPGGR